MAANHGGGNSGGGTHISVDVLRSYRDSPMVFFENVVIERQGKRVKFGDEGVMAAFQREAFEAAAPCLQAVASGRVPPIRGLWLERTKGASKDSDVALMVLWLLLFSPKPLAMETGADDQDQAKEMMGAADEWVRLNPWMQQRLEFQRDRIFCPQTRSQLDFLTTPSRNDAGGTHGSRPHVSIINELSHISVEGFAATMFDNADKRPENLVLVATNAGSRRLWQWKWRELYRDRATASDPTTKARWYFQKVDAPAPWISRANLEDARIRNSKARYARLWQGVWSTGEGDAIDQADIDACLTLDGPHAEAAPWWVYGAGLDLGTKRDHAALVVMGTEMGSGRVAVVRVCGWRPPGNGEAIDLQAVREAVWDAFLTFGLFHVGYDASQAVLMAQELRGRGVPMQEVFFAGKNLDLMASTLMQAFRDRTLDLWNGDQDLLDDIGRLAIEEKRWGHKLAAVSDEHGHADRAIALAIGLPVMMEVANTQTEEDADDGGSMPSRVTT